MEMCKTNENKPDVWQTLMSEERQTEACEWHTRREKDLQKHEEWWTVR